jgi:hypothetical protein
MYDADLFLDEKPLEPGAIREFPPLTPHDSTTAIAEALFRTTISADAVLTATDVVRAIGGREGIVRNWLRDAVRPLRHPSGRTIYRWGDVLAAMSRVS